METGSYYSNPLTSVSMSLNRSQENLEENQAHHCVCVCVQVNGYASRLFPVDIMALWSLDSVFLLSPVALLVDNIPRMDMVPRAGPRRAGPSRQDHSTQ